MKKTNLCVIGLVVMLFLVVSCKQNQKDEDNVGSSPGTTKTESSSKTEAVQDSLSKLSLKELITEYKKYHKVKDTSQFVDYQKILMTYLVAIGDRHEVCPADYKTYTEKFWGVGKTPLELPIVDTDLTDFADADEGNYVRITFTSVKDNKFNFHIGPFFSFKSCESCITVALFQKIAADKNYVSLSITKGTKYITRSVDYPYDTGNYEVAILIYKSKDETGKLVTQYYDIVEDPTHTLNTYSINCNK